MRSGYYQKIIMISDNIVNVREFVWDKVNETKMGKYLDKVERYYLKSFFESYKINKCLEIGAGSGRITIPVSQFVSSLTATDVDPVPLEILMSKIDNDAITVRLCDGNDLPFDSGSFDCILAIQCIEYIDVKKCIRDCNRLLKDGGYLIFTIANKRSLKYLFYRIHSKNHRFYKYSYGGIRSLLEDMGFTILMARGYCWLPFGRASNSRLIDIFSALEDALRLKNIPSVSPNLFIITYKKNNPDKNMKSGL